MLRRPESLIYTRRAPPSPATLSYGSLPRGLDLYLMLRCFVVILWIDVAKSMVLRGGCLFVKFDNGFKLSLFVEQVLK